MYGIPFTTRVLGKEAAIRLLLHQVTRTVRARGNVLPLLEAQRNGNKVAVTLDTKFVGYAVIENVASVSWAALKSTELHLHGFSDVAELRGALRRAGFRFKDLDEYDLYLVAFSWAD